MNRLIKVGVAAVALAAVVPAFAEDVEEEESGAVGWTPIALGIASPVQLPWGLAQWDVFGIDVNVLYSDAPKMYGLGVGGLAMTTRDTMAGLQASALFNYAKENVYGVRLALGANVCREEAYGLEAGCFGYRREFWGLDVDFLGSFQDYMWGMQVSGLANITREQTYGWQTAIGVNIAKKAYGLQLAAIFNMAEELHGCQIAIVNYAQECPWGFQIGIINIIMDNSLKVLPILNAYF
jgi:hypothetical protein